MNGEGMQAGGRADGRTGGRSEKVARCHPERSEGSCRGMIRTRPEKIPRSARDDSGRGATSVLSAFSVLSTHPSSPPPRSSPRPPSSPPPPPSSPPRPHHSFARPEDRVDTERQRRGGQRARENHPRVRERQPGGDRIAKAAGADEGGQRRRTDVDHRGRPDAGHDHAAPRAAAARNAAPAAASSRGPAPRRPRRAPRPAPRYRCFAGSGYSEYRKSATSAGTTPMPSSGIMKASSAIPGIVCRTPTARMTGSAPPRGALEPQPERNRERDRAAERHATQQEVPRREREQRARARPRGRRTKPGARPGRPRAWRRRRGPSSPRSRARRPRPAPPARRPPRSGG